MNLTEFRRLPLLGILRGVVPDAIEPLAEAVVASGLKTIEITMNTRGAPDLIRRMTGAAGGRLTVGAGTVLSVGELHAALDAGASFIVMPTVIEDVLQYCARNSIPVFPGALTPQEIFNAWRSGATMVKVFPANIFGPAYFKELKGPFQSIELLACGGITPGNLAEYFSCGASAVAFGASIFNREWMENGEFSRIGAAIRELVQAFQHARDAKVSTTMKGVSNG